MILQLALALLTGCGSAHNTGAEHALKIEAGVYYFNSYENVRHAGTSDTIWIKHGDNMAISIDQCYPRSCGRVRFPSNQELSVTQDTWVWTTGHDALLVDFFYLHADDAEMQWGVKNYMGWCLSMDHWNDAAQFNWENWGSNGDIHVVPTWRCYELLELNSDGLVYYYYDQDWRPNHHGNAFGRRALMEEAGIPSVEDVKACEADPATDTNQDCGPMVDAIINWEKEHWMKGEAGRNVDVVDIPDIDDGNSEEDMPDIDEGNTDTETATDDRRVLSALRRLLKA